MSGRLPFFPRLRLALDGRLEWIWLAIAGPVAVCMALLTPPFQSPDEDGHFLRACQVAQGTWRGTLSAQRTPEAPTPAAAVALTQIRGYHIMRFHPSQKVDVIRPSESRPDLLTWDGAVTRAHNVSLLYAPTAYATAAVGIVIGKGAGLGVLKTFYLARLCVCFSSLFLGFAALRLAVGYRWLLFLTLSLPTTLFLFGALHQDANLIAATALGVALLTRTLHSTGTPLRGAEIVAGLLALGFVSLGKYTYLPLFGAALVLFLYRQPARWKLILGLGAGVFAVILTWLILNREISACPVREGTQPTEQMARVLHDPGAFLVHSLTDIYMNYRFHADTTVGVMGWMDTWMPRWSLATLQFTLIAAFVLGVIGYFRAARPLWPWLLVGAALLGAGVLIYLSQYVLWNPVGSVLVEGIQGRYFLPLLLFASLLCGKVSPAGAAPSDESEAAKRAVGFQSALDAFYVGLAAGAGLLACLCVYWRYY